MIYNSISINNLCISRSQKSLFDNFSLEIEKGKVTCIIAPSGSGKTTLLNYIAGTLDEKSCDIKGSILFNGSVNRPSMSFLFQEPRLISSATVLQNVLLPLVNKMDIASAEKVAKDFLFRVELSDKLFSFPRNLSGGEERRVSIARAFSFQSDILLMDEPFHSQDLRIKISIINMLKKLLQIDNRTVLFVTHDAKEAVSLSDRIIVMSGHPLKIIYDEIVTHKNDTELENKIASYVVYSSN